MKNIRKIFILIAAIVVVSSCDLNKLDNPSKLTPSQADPDLLLNQVQVFTPDFFTSLGDFGLQMTRLSHFYGPNFENGFTPLSFDYPWASAYSNILVNAKTVIPLAQSAQLYMHSGMAKVIYAYVGMTLVDFFGDVPFSEALDPKNLAPKADGGASIYAASITMLDDAIADFKKQETKQPLDLFYGGDKKKWITLANTLKLRAYMNTRLVDSGAAGKIAALITAGDLIDTPEESWVFQYSSNIANPDSRHPYFSARSNQSGNYLTGAGTFQSNWLMWNMYQGKIDASGNRIEDPRIRYYFYRQTWPVSGNVNLIACVGRSRPPHYTNPNWPFCRLDVNSGYWGRDFGDATGVNPDTQSRTNWGVYPIGGKFDAGVPGDVSTFGPNTATDGLSGAGIAPILMHWSTDFIKAEYYLMLANNAGSAKASMSAGVANSISYVMNFGASAAAKDGAESMIPSALSIANYTGKVASLYDAASSNDAKLDVIMREYWIATFGNGVEAYNSYRRTGKPSAMQPPLSPNPGKFYRSFTYPSTYVTRNGNATQKSGDDVKVFWDTNPDGFIY